MSICERSVTCSFLFKNCTHILIRTQKKKFEDLFLVIIANKGTSLSEPKSGQGVGKRGMNFKDNEVNTVRPRYTYRTHKLIRYCGVRYMRTFFKANQIKGNEKPFDIAGACHDPVFDIAEFDSSAKKMMISNASLKNSFRKWVTMIQDTSCRWCDRNLQPLGCWEGVEFTSWCIDSLCIYQFSIVIDFSSEKYSGSTGNKNCWYQWRKFTVMMPMMGPELATPRLQTECSSQNDKYTMNKYTYWDKLISFPAIAFEL